MFEILFASSSFILRLATLVKSAEVWVKDFPDRDTDPADWWGLKGPLQPSALPFRNDQAFISLFQIIFMEDKEE